MHLPTLSVRAAALAFSVGAALALAPRPARAFDPAPWILDVNLGKPSLASDSFVLAVDGALGYSTPTLGAVGRGSLGAYDLTAKGTETETVHDEGTVEAWYIVGQAQDAFRLECRLTGGAALYSSTYDPGQTARGFYHDEDSLMRRATLLVGGHARWPTFQLVFHLGAGGQFETYDYLSTNPRDALLKSEDTASVREEGRLHLRWVPLPEQLSVRARVEASRFALTRSALIVGQTGTVRRTGNHFEQIDVSARAFVDFDLITLLTIVPSVFVGLDHVSLDGAAGAQSTTVPIFGLGLVKPDVF